MAELLGEECCNVIRRRLKFFAPRCTAMVIVESPLCRIIWPLFYEIIAVELG